MICRNCNQPAEDPTFELLDATAHVAQAFTLHDRITHFDRLADDNLCFEFYTPDGRLIIAEVDIRLVDA